MTETRSHDQHGLVALKAALSKRTKRGKVRLAIEKRLDLRYPAARALISERDAWLQDMGGPEVVSGKQLTLVEAALKTNLYIQHLDSWLMSQRSLVNFKKRSVVPVLRERQALVDSLARLLGLLGLERRCKPVETLERYLQQTSGEEAKSSKTTKGPRLEEYMERKPAEAESESEPDADEAEDSKGELREVDWEDIAEEVDDDQM